MSQTPFAYTATDTLPQAWQKFAVNVMSLHDPAAGQGFYRVLTADPALPTGYTNDLYRFDTLAYLRQITGRLNRLLIPNAGSIIFTTGSNLTSHYIPLQKRDAANRLGMSTARFTHYLRERYTLGLNRLPVWAQRSALDTTIIALRAALGRLNAQAGAEESLARAYLLTTQREELLALPGLVCPPDENLAMLFSAIEADVYRLLYG